jgi:hypothetical protein
LSAPSSGFAEMLPNEPACDLIVIVDVVDVCCNSGRSCMHSMHLLEFGAAELLFSGLLPRLSDLPRSLVDLYRLWF